jgi:hypothetical protein
LPKAVVRLRTSTDVAPACAERERRIAEHGDPIFKTHEPPPRAQAPEPGLTDAERQQVAGWYSYLEQRLALTDGNVCEAIKAMRTIAKAFDAGLDQLRQRVDQLENRQRGIDDGRVADLSNPIRRRYAA